MFAWKRAETSWKVKLLVTFTFLHRVHHVWPMAAGNEKTSSCLQQTRRRYKGEVGMKASVCPIKECGHGERGGAR